MAYSTISKPILHFNTKLYTGNSSTNAQTGVGFQPDWIWFKRRDSAAQHSLFDVVRGVTKQLSSNLNSAETTISDALTSFDSDGFTLGADSGNYINLNSATYAAWNWKAGGTGSANSDGDIASTVSANTTAGFSVVKWTSNGSNSDTIGHGLGVAPKIVLYKRYDASNNWYWLYKYVDGTLDYLHLNLNNAKADLTLGTYGFTTSTTITNLGFGNNDSLIAYCFAEKKGYSKFGSYVGNGNADGTFVYTGFKPAYVLIKDTTTAGSGHSWCVWDNKRSTSNPTTKLLLPDATDSEYTITDPIDFYSNGFKIRDTNGSRNDSGSTYIYMAFAKEPFVANETTNGVPATAR
tara:strand:+ start:987 stop:2033 length:1047 start_codon:yes stop_codon:yes gene_type:complete